MINKVAILISILVSALIVGCSLGQQDTSSTPRPKNVETILRSTESQTGDANGFSVAIDGSYAIMGAYQEDGGAGDPRTSAGAAYIYRNTSGDNWSEVDILRASDLESGDKFGYSVAISGDYALVGAHDAEANAGAAYVFKNDGSDNWNELEILSGSDTSANDSFGERVNINGVYAIVGAPYEDGGAGDPLSSAGSVYIFKRDGMDDYAEVALLTASDAQANDFFGASVSMTDSYALIGAYGEDGGTGNPISNSGAAYLFKNDGLDNWSEIEILRASDSQAQDKFGRSVSISGSYAIVGAYGEDGGDGDSAADAGAAYIYKNDGSDNWNEETIFLASDSQTGDRLGWSLAINGSTAIIGAYNEDGGDTDPLDNAGAGYVINNISY